MLEVGNFIADRYEILSKVGAGGMSDVYKAKDQILNRYVAIKVLKSEFSEDVSFVTKFRAEAQSAAVLEHPNIVNIYDVGSEDGLYFIVMEYVEGITLKTYIEKKGLLSFKEAASIAIQVARGIEAAHKNNIIHRDIKPQNIIISTEGKVKVTDFGIAKAASSNTISSDVMGSVHYASPEQARNGFVDARSDIYSLGIVMFEMITGRVPFDGDTTVAVALQHLQEEIDRPSKYAPGIPKSFENIILKCTQKTPDRRYQSIAELLADLRRSLTDPEGDFVVIAPLVDNSKTKVISQEDLNKINENRGGVVNNVSSLDQPETDEEEDEDEEEEGFLNPKMDKAVTIMGIVTAIIIFLVIIYLVLSVAGVFNFSKKSNGNSQMTESQNVSESETESEIEEVEMINITGMSYEDAEKKLKSLGLVLFAYEAKASNEEDGTILEQDTAAGTKVKKGSQINVVIAGDSLPTDELIDVPNVVGKGVKSAQNTLEGAGFKVNVEYEASDSVTADTVISQNPGSKSKKAKGATVTIVVSKGQDSATVPNVVGSSEAAAKSSLESAGLTYSVSSEYSDNVPAGNVISQTISANKKVEKGTCVSIKISLGSNLVEIPNVVGMAGDEAYDVITGAGFTCNVVEEYSSAEDEYQVIRQSATGRAEKGKTVTITVSLGAKEPDPGTGEATQ